MSRQNQYVLREIEEKDLDPRMEYVSGKNGLSPHPKKTRNDADTEKETVSFTEVTASSDLLIDQSISNNVDSAIEVTQVVTSDVATSLDVSTEDSQVSIASAEEPQQTNDTEVTVQAVEEKPKKKFGKKSS